MFGVLCFLCLCAYVVGIDNCDALLPNEVCFDVGFRFPCLLAGESCPSSRRFNFIIFQVSKCNGNFKAGKNHNWVVVTRHLYLVSQQCCTLSQNGGRSRACDVSRKLLPRIRAKIFNLVCNAAAWIRCLLVFYCCTHDCSK